MKTYNLNELHIMKDQENNAHLCTCDSHFLKKEDSLYKQSKIVAAPIGWYRYTDVFDNSVVQITDVYSEIMDYVINKRNHRFLSTLKQNGISISKIEECTIEEIENLWKQVQEKKVKGFQKRMKIK